MKPIEIPQNEHGVVRVFTLSMTGAEARALRDNGGPTSPQEKALGAALADAGGVEIFAVSDLGALGLAGYLREGIDADEAQISRDRAKLAAVDGWVMVVYSAAFGGAAATLRPIPALTLLGTYTMMRPNRDAIPLESAAAQPYTGVPDATPPVAPGGRPAGAMVVVGLVVLTALILWWALA